MTNLELVKAFAEGATSGHTIKSPYYGGSVYVASIHGDNLYSYNTAIAVRTKDGIILNANKYSSTTSKLQGMIRKNCNVIKEVHNAHSIY